MEECTLPARCSCSNLSRIMVSPSPSSLLSAGTDRPCSDALLRPDFPARVLPCLLLLLSSLPLPARLLCLPPPPPTPPPSSRLPVAVRLGGRLDGVLPAALGPAAGCCTADAIKPAAATRSQATAMASQRHSRAAWSKQTWRQIVKQPHCHSCVSHSEESWR